MAVKKTLSVKSLKGVIPKSDKPISIEEMNQAIAEGAVRRYERFLKQVEYERANESQQIRAHDKEVKSK